MDKICHMEFFEMFLHLNKAVPFKTITTVILTEWYDTLKTIDNHKNIGTYLNKIVCLFFQTQLGPFMWTLNTYFFNPLLVFIKIVELFSTNNFYGTNSLAMASTLFFFFFYLLKKKEGI